MQLHWVTRRARQPAMIANTFNVKLLTKITRLWWKTMFFYRPKVKSSYNKFTDVWGFWWTFISTKRFSSLCFFFRLFLFHKRNCSYNQHKFQYCQKKFFMLGLCNIFGGELTLHWVLLFIFGSVMICGPTLARFTINFTIKLYKIRWATALSLLCFIFHNFKLVFDGFAMNNRTILHWKWKILALIMGFCQFLSAGLMFFLFIFIVYAPWTV